MLLFVLGLFLIGGGAQMADAAKCTAAGPDTDAARTAFYLGLLILLGGFGVLLYLLGKAMMGLGVP
ncbi:hypothetical protein ACM7NO_26015 [Pseudomonas aeruginosa]